MRFRTPSLGHLSTSEWLHVYEPAEDTFLFLDALEADLQHLQDLYATVCLEVGSGSGCVLTFLGSLLDSSCLLLATDINPRATVATAQTAIRNGQTVDVIRTDLIESLLPRLENCVDVLLFNPPYVVTPREEVGSHGIAASWAGGEKGREVTDRLLPLVPKLLSQRGTFYLVTIPENDPEEIVDYLQTQGFECKTILYRKSGPERLSIQRFTRHKTNNDT